MPRLEDFDLRATHRLIPTKFSESGSVLEVLPVPQPVLDELSELDGATNERIRAEMNLGVAIGPGELLFGVPEAAIVNAAFTHASAMGGRFNDATRGAWYAGVELETSQAEVAFHKRRFLEDTRFALPLTFEYADFLADFAASFHVLEGSEQAACLKPEPIPECYAASQKLARSLLHEGSNGLVYPSVRSAGGNCVACFRPALVYHPRRGRKYALTVAAGVPWNARKSARELSA